jgi:adenylate kinase
MSKTKRDWVAIFIELSEEKAFERMMLRGRSDDTPEAIKTRIHAYQQETVKIIDEFEQLGKVKRVNGDDTIENVFANICSVIDSLSVS